MLKNDEMNRKLFAGVKFFGDRILSIVLIILLLPLFAIAAIAIVIEDGRPILFKQERTGKDGKLFNIYKFRTMVVSNDVYDQTVSDQFTKVGKVLRRLSIDEIPQLFMIAVGKMSFIGPRPWIHNYYENMTDEQRHRYDVRPGLTGLAQVMGRNHLTIFEKISYDLSYINQYSLTQELRIILMTVKTISSGSGADSGKETIHEELEELRKNKAKRTYVK